MKTILLAPHDDGFGAFSTMCALARSLRVAAKRKGVTLRLVFISGKKAAEDLGRCRGPRTHLLKADLLYEISRDPKTGLVAPPAILKVVEKISRKARNWERGIRWGKCKAHGGKNCRLSWNSIDLCIGMGVPWLHRAARRHKVPSIELGDTSVSLILRGCLKEGGRLTAAAKRVLNRVAKDELMADEAWLLPFATPPVYETHFASGGVPVNWLPGLFGTREPGAEKKAKALRKKLRKDKRVGKRFVVGVHSGKTITWDPIKRKLAAPNKSGKCVYVTAGMGPELYPLKQGSLTLPSAKVRSTSLMAQDLCLTRGGISALEHIVACCPIAITEEPLHWLSHEQRAALVRAGLCIPISLCGLRRDPDRLCTALLKKQKSKLERIKRRMAGIQCDADQWFADYVLKFLNV